jgi:hypothetical protein
VCSAQDVVQLHVVDVAALGLMIKAAGWPAGLTVMSKWTSPPLLASTGKPAGKQRQQAALLLLLCASTCVVCVGVQLVVLPSVAAIVGKGRWLACRLDCDGYIGVVRTMLGINRQACWRAPAALCCCCYVCL